MVSIERVVNTCHRLDCCPLGLAALEVESLPHIQYPAPNRVARDLGLTMRAANEVAYAWDYGERDRDGVEKWHIYAVERAIKLGLGPRLEAALARIAEKVVG